MHPFKAIFVFVYFCVTGVLIVYQLCKQHLYIDMQRCVVFFTLLSFSF